MPSFVLNQPLKSTLHTSLAWTAPVNGSLHAEAFLRRRLRLTSPARSRIPPAVLGAGQATSGYSARSRPPTSWDPRSGWLASPRSIRYLRTRRSDAGALPRSPRPSNPSYRLIRLCPVTRLIPNRRHSPDTDSSPEPHLYEHPLLTGGAGLLPWHHIWPHKVCSYDGSMCNHVPGYLLTGSVYTQMG